jgi:hypothetical protein
MYSSLTRVPTNFQANVRKALCAMHNKQAAMIVIFILCASFLFAFCKSCMID